MSSFEQSQVSEDGGPITTRRSLVACLRWAPEGAGAISPLEASDQLARDFASAGGRVVAWGADRLCCAFELRDFPRALRVAIDALTASASHAVGFSGRDLHFRDVAGDSRAWGPAMLVADALANAAKPGEILLDPTLEAVEQGQLATLGSIPARVGNDRVSGVLLIPGSCPPDGYRPSDRPPPPALPPQSDAPTPAASPGTVSQGPVGRGLRSRAPEKPPSLIPPEGAQDPSPSVKPRRSVPPPKPKLQAVSDEDAGMSMTSLAQDSDPNPRPRTSMIEQLRAGRAEAVLQLTQHFRLREGGQRLAERVEALARLARGDSAGLDVLADALKAARESGVGAEGSAALAYAMGLAIAGKKRRALLEGLSALGLARTRRDDSGERACASFLAQLAAAEGEHDVARGWLTLVHAAT